MILNSAPRHFSTLSLSLLVFLCFSSTALFAQTDTDSDGMPDAWEISYQYLNYQVDDAAGDVDLDGVTNLREFLTNTDPTDSNSFIAPDLIVPIAVSDITIFIPTPADTDGDGITDEWEMANQLNPADPSDAVGDLDSDGVNNLAEFVFGSNPNLADDSDGDGLPNLFEIGTGFNPLLRADGAQDADNDGASNLDEYYAASDPHDFLDCNASTCNLDPAPSPNPVIIPPADALSDSVGSIAGSMSVSPSGSARYTIPLLTPAGTAGLAPNLSVSYDSSRGNGLMGSGWSSSGYSAITRCRSTMVQDGVAREVEFSALDRFCLDGQKLVLVNAASNHYGGNGSEYRTEIDSNRKVVFYGTYFRVWNADGSVVEYGNTAGSRLSPVNAPASYPVYKWGRNRIQDATSYNSGGSNNAINYSYINSPSTADFRLDKIEYAYGNDSVPGAVIEFNYENRPDQSDGYRSGTFYSLDYRLSNIVVKNDGVELRTYGFDYLDNTASNSSDPTSRLASINECRGATCLPPTTFTWSGQGMDFSFATTANPLSGFQNYMQHAPSDVFSPVEYSSSIAASVDGDGFTDLIWLEVMSGQHYFKVAQSNGSSLVNTSYSSVGFGNIYGWTTIDYNLDSYTDFLVVTEELDGVKLKLFLNKQTTTGRGYDTNPIELISDLDYSEYNSLDLELASFSDINNDGLLDLFYRGKYRLLESDPAQVNGPYHYGTEQVLNQNNSLHFEVASKLNTAGLQGEVPRTKDGFNLNFTGLSVDLMRIGADFNADGIGDLIAPAFHDNCDGNINCDTELAMQVVFTSDGAGGFDFFDYFIVDRDYRLVDLNRDGLIDILCGNGDIQYNDGTKFVNGAISPGIATLKLHSLMDYDGDGYVDYIYKEPGTTNINALLWQGDSFDAPVNAITIANTTFTEAYGPIGSFFDISGDGSVDYVEFNTGVYLGLNASTSTNATKDYGLITSIVDGLGSEKFIEYKPLSDSTVYEKETDANTLVGWEYPVVDVINTSYVVSKLSSIAPAFNAQTNSVDTNATSSISYRYKGYKAELGGRGPLGFHMTIVRDDQTGVETHNTFLQQFPFTGLRMNAKTIIPNNSNPLNETVFSYTKLNNLNGPDVAPLRVVSTQSVTTTRAATTQTGSSAVTVLPGALSTVTLTLQNYDTYGVAGRSTTTVTGDGIARTTITDNTYTNDEQNWHIGKLISTTVTSSQTGLTSLTRQAAFSYDATTGLLSSEVSEPNQPQYTLSTTYQRDNYGNRIRANEIGAGVTRYTQVVYDANGRYVDDIYNSLGQHLLEVVSRSEYGSPTQTKNLNGVNSYTAYSPMGRAYFEANDSGSYSRSQLRSCGQLLSACPTGASYRVRNFAADGSQAFAYYDNLGRTIRQETPAFTEQVYFDPSGVPMIKSDVYYDNSGRVKATSNPYLPGEAALLNYSDFDVLGRPIMLTDAANAQSHIAYSVYSNGSFTGNQVQTTNAESQTRTTISDASGLTTEVTDHLGGRIGYEYDVRGNLTKLISKGSAAESVNIETHISYDLLGRRLTLDDPDQGIWNYQYSVFGELTKQIDVLGQSSEMSYDLLGRLVNRVDRKAGGSIEGNTSWIYDTANNGLGQLSTESDSISGFTRAYNYDHLGRISQSYTSLGTNGSDGVYSEYLTYDQIGRPFQQIDATNYGVQYKYSANGYVEEIVEATNTSKSYYKVQATDAWGNVSQALLGNGLTEQNTYQTTTGLPKRTQITNAAATTIQDNNYTFNDIGTLTGRDRYVQANASTLSETFHYDELNRLTMATATGLPSQTFSYDITGNMISKSDVGTYSYGGGNAGPHAVTQIGGDTYTYDAAGNMLTGGGRTVVYNSFRKPTQITKGGHTTSFEYGVDRARYKRVDFDGTDTKQVIYAGSVEFITENGLATETKRYVNGVAIVTYTAEGTTEHYTHKDLLGSIDIITDTSGNVVSEMSFDAFGKRRNLLTLTDLAEVEYGALNSLTTRGFTGHEMLDEVGVIHMNGRVYDPVIGRFMSADPIIQDLGNTQHLNRYSYVWNSPLSFTDPSGFDGDDLWGGGGGGWTGGGFGDVGIGSQGDGYGGGGADNTDTTNDTSSTVDNTPPTVDGNSSGIDNGGGQADSNDGPEESNNNEESEGNNGSDTGVVTDEGTGGTGGDVGAGIGGFSAPAGSQNYGPTRPPFSGPPGAFDSDGPFVGPINRLPRPPVSGPAGAWDSDGPFVGPINRLPPSMAPPPQVVVADVAPASGTPSIAGDAGRLVQLGGGPEDNQRTWFENYVHNSIDGFKGASIHDAIRAFEGLPAGQEIVLGVKGAGLLFGIGRISDRVLRVGPYTYTRTASLHLGSRPYMASTHLISQIVSTGRGVRDPGGLANAIRYDVDGTFNGSKGAYELVLGSDNTIFHFLFTSSK